ncbi:hypothetical protein [Flectobacillus rivi]|uniref:Lipoprotein n=1 Tax=Flectobacillus rivi TaxID=2984209 RepID=A0ABT6YXJ7_9BACT|nr:hypothetical protein [Flectobacillus rivi]MDI9873600.1 hypothetical protein [Flectobacillus rivi]
MQKIYPIKCLKLSDSYWTRGFYFFLATLFYACSSLDSTELQPIILSSKDYLMQEKGQFCVFSVHQLSYTLNSKPTESLFFEKHTVIDHPTHEGVLVVIFRKNQENANWIETGRKLVVLQNSKIIEIQSNQTQCILVNPIEVGTQWNFQLYNQAKAQQAQIIRFLPQAIYANKTMSNLIEVELFKDSSALSLQKKQVILAPNWGIVFSKESNVSYCYEGNCLGKGQINYGTVITYDLIDYGKE